MEQMPMDKRVDDARKNPIKRALMALGIAVGGFATEAEAGQPGAFSGENISPSGKINVDNRKLDRVSDEEVRKLHPDYNPDDDHFTPYRGETSGERTPVRGGSPNPVYDTKHAEGGQTMLEAEKERRKNAHFSPEEKARIAEGEKALEKAKQDAYEAAERASDGPITERTKPRE
jgi:hypothetical protein